MPKTLRIILPLLLALNFLGAADLLRPRVHYQPLDNGIQVELDFQHVTELQWYDILEQPELFHNHGYGVAGSPGEAALPMFTLFVPLAQHAAPLVSSVNRTDYPLQELSLKAAPAGHLDSDQTAVEIQPYDWNQTQRSQPIEVQPGEIFQIDGHLYLPITIRPVQLNRTDLKVEVPMGIQFEVSGVELGDASRISEDGGILSVTLPEEQFVSRGHYLIISPAQFLDYIQYFADWKTRMGYKVTVVGTAITGSTATNIKAYIQDAWDTWEVRPDYLVLVGDEDRGIPGHYIQNPQGDNLVTDHPYGLLEGDDSFPELMVGRLSVDTISELVSFTSKIVRYESEPHMDDTNWFQRALMISTNWGAASAQATKEWVADKLTEKGFDQVYTAYHPEVFSTSHIANPINAGVGYVNYRGFGMYNGWFGPDFMISDIYNLINSGSKTPIITSVVCGGGNFAAESNDPCFGEVWTRIGTFSVPNGAVAFFGPSELYTHTQFNNVIDIGIYSGIFDHGITTLGEALWHGKFELWRNYHQNTYFPFDQTPEFYHHVYNLLGDPGMQLWTTVPEILTVNHVDTLIAGDNFVEVSVSNAAGDMVRGSYVALSHAENTWGGYTDSNGSLILPFEAGVQEAVHLTVTGENLHPYLATLPILNLNHPLELQEWTLEGGHQPVSGEITQVWLTLDNPGPELNGVEISFSANIPNVEFGESIVIDIPAQSTLLIDSVDVVIPHLEHGTPMTMALQIQTTESTWSWQKHFSIQAPLIQISSIDVLNGGLHVGESAEFQLEMYNQGGAISEPLTLTALESELYSWSSNEATCPPIGIDASEVATESMTITFHENLFPGENITLRWECIRGDITDTLDYTIQLGGANRFGPSMSDAYGYRMFDIYDLSFSKAPVYEWLEIDGTRGGDGTEVYIYDNWEEEDASQVLNLPFTVNYYGIDYDHITVCTNGWAAFGEHSVVNFHNRTIPSNIGPPAMLAPFWDDLVTIPGSIYYKHDVTNDLYIIEWSRMRNLFASNELTFQLVIYGSTLNPTETGENDIKFQYRDFQNVDISSNFSTIGIESPDSRTGIQASYNNINDPSIGEFSNGMALLFTTDRGERLGDSEIAFSATSLSFQQNPWSSVRDSIMISNTGESPLIYEINVVPELMLEPAEDIPLDPSITKDTPDTPGEDQVMREGSDAYGYTWKDNHDEGGPEYNWIDIEMESNLLPYESLEFDDCTVGPIDLGFDFPLYDDVYSSGYIGSNGTVTFEGLHSPWYNISFPSGAAPSSILAVWWDDLNNDVGDQGTFYFWSNGFDQCIMTWKNFPKHGTDSFYTFQVILDAYGTIKYQYQDIGEIIASSTIGLQNSDRNFGLTVRHNETTPMEGGTAIVISPPNRWFSASGWTEIIHPGESVPFIIDIQSRNSEAGLYEKNLVVSTTAPNAPETMINISLDVVLGETPFGDINGDYLVNIHDVTDLYDFILMFEEMNNETFDQADLSGDDQVNVADLILLIESINAMGGQ